VSLSVKQARLLSEKSQSEVADKMGICVQTYRKLEEKPEKMTMAQAKLFCAVVNRELDELIFCQ